MIRLGMTDCPAVRGLLNRGELQLDYLEVHGPYAENARQAFPQMPMLLHNALYQWSLAHPDGMVHMDAAAVTRERLALTSSPWYSLHLGFSCSEVEFIDEAMVALSPLLPRERVYERSLETLQRLMQVVEVPVLIENLDYNPSDAYEYVCEPDFISRIVEESGAFLLFDLAHARVSASAFDVPLEDYIAGLPLERVRQIHLNRPDWRGGRLVDAHVHLDEADYAMLETLLQRCQPWSITLEYNRDEEKILEQIARLRAMTARFDAAA